MDWTAITVAAATGLGSGFLASMATPFVQRRVEETKLRTQARRDLIAHGRLLVAEASTHRWSQLQVAADPRYLNLRRHLAPQVQDFYTIHGSLVVRSAGTNIHAQLTSEIDRLEAEWALV